MKSHKTHILLIILLIFGLVSCNQDDSPSSSHGIDPRVENSKGGIPSFHIVKSDGSRISIGDLKTNKKPLSFIDRLDFGQIERKNLTLESTLTCHQLTGENSENKVIKVNRRFQVPHEFPLFSLMSKKMIFEGAVNGISYSCNIELIFHSPRFSNSLRFITHTQKISVAPIQFGIDLRGSLSQDLSFKSQIPYSSINETRVLSQDRADTHLQLICQNFKVSPLPPLKRPRYLSEFSFNIAHLNSRNRKNFSISPSLQLCQIFQWTFDLNKQKLILGLSHPIRIQFPEPNFDYEWLWQNTSYPSSKSSFNVAIVKLHNPTNKNVKINFASDQLDKSEVIQVFPNQNSTYRSYGTKIDYSLINPKKVKLDIPSGQSIDIPIKILNYKRCQISNGNHGLGHGPMLESGFYLMNPQGIELIIEYQFDRERNSKISVVRPDSLEPIGFFREPITELEKKRKKSLPQVGHLKSIPGQKIHCH